MRAFPFVVGLIFLLSFGGSLQAGVPVGMAYYSLGGNFSSGTDVAQFIFDTIEVGPADPMQFATFHNAGGTNEAGDIISAGGFDPTLGFKESGGLSFDAFDDNDGPVSDAVILRGELGAPSAGDAIPGGSYELHLAADGASLRGLDPNWAVDLIGPASSNTTFTDIATVGNPSISSLKYGTTTSGALDFATLAIDNANSLSITGELNVATTGVAILSIDGGANLSVGSLVGGIGALFSHDDGTLTINGGTFSPGVADYAVDGNVPADSPTLKMINGATGSFGGFFDVGNFNRGRLEVLSGSTMTVDTLSIGFDPSSEGDILISGPGSEISATTSQIIGFSGTGNIEVLDGGKMSSVTDAEIAAGVGAAGSGVIVSGAGSMWEVMLDLTIGDSDRGIVRVENGALVTVAGDASIAFFNGAANSEATITGDNSQMNITGDLVVGDEDVGTMTISAGGSVTSADAFLGRFDAAATGTVNVTGSGTSTPSSWQAADIFIGGSGLSPSGIGQLNVGNGAEVTAENITVWNTGGVELDNGNLSVTTMAVEGNLTGDGTVTVASGGFLNNRGTVAPGFSTAVMNITGDYIQESAGSLDIEINGTGGAGTDHDNLAVSGVATLDGMLNLILNGFAPNYFDEFVIHTYGSRIGQFQSVAGAFVSSSMTLAPIYGNGELKLVAALPGDGDLNGIVNFDDFVLVSNSFGNPDTEWGSGDFSLNGLTNFNDFVILSNNFAMSALSGGAVPEPTALSLIVITFGLGLFRKCTRPSNRNA